MQPDLGASFGAHRRSVILAIGADDGAGGEVAILVADDFQIGDDAGGFRACRVLQGLGDCPERHAMPLLGELALNLVDPSGWQLPDGIGQPRGEGKIALVLATIQRDRAACRIDDIEKGFDHALTRRKEQNIELA